MMLSCLAHNDTYLHVLFNGMAGVKGPWDFWQEINRVGKLHSADKFHCLSAIVLVILLVNIYPEVPV